MVFPLLMLIMVLLSSLFIAVGFLRKAHSDRQAPVFKDFYHAQLAEIDAQIARGEIDTYSAQKARNEIARRFSLCEDALSEGAVSESARTSSGESLTQPLRPHIFVRLVLFLASGAIGLYWMLGAWGMADNPRALRLQAADIRLKTRPEQSAFEAQLPAQNAPPEGETRTILQLLREKVGREKDAIGLRLLANMEADLGEYASAHRSWKRYLDAVNSQNAQEYAFYSQLLRRAAHGYISPEAEKAARSALALDPQNAAAQQMIGMLYLQIGRPDKAFLIFKHMLDEKLSKEPNTQTLRQLISEAAIRAGIRYAPNTQDASISE